MQKTIGIIPGFASQGHRRLVSLLAEVFAFHVEERGWNNLEGLSAALILDRQPALKAMEIARQLPVYVVEKTGNQNGTENRSKVEFSRSPALDAVLRGQAVSSQEASEASPLREDDPNEVMARVNGRPVWVVSTGCGHRFARCSISAPEPLPEQQLLDFLNGDRFLGLLPLYHFLRRIAGEEGWQSPPLRASLIIDDPNLRTLNYGNIDYRRLLERAKSSNFHVAMATVPLDAWSVSQSAAQIFRENRRWLSLLIHGNNHTREELAQEIPRQRQISLLAEALRRADFLEENSGVPVLRVMVPPHGSCSEEFMSAMVLLGFKGCVATTGPWLWRKNKSSDRAASVGLQLADILAGGLPVVNRFRFNSKACPAKILIAAFLGQPIIPYGHHTDISPDGEDSLNHAVELINSLGEVKWMNLSDILEGNFLFRVQGECLQVKLFSKRVRLTVPESIRAVDIQTPGFSEDAFCGIQVTGKTPAGTRWNEITVPGPVTVAGGSEVVITVKPFISLGHSAPRYGNGSLTLALRRIAAELRDRLAA
jgi:hypothetical protein